MAVSEISFGFNVPKISTLNEIFSPDFIIYGVPWKVKIKKMNRNGVDWLKFFLKCTNTDKSSNLSYVASASFKVLPFESNHDVIEGHVEPFVFDCTEFGYGSWILSWCDLFENTNSYVKNDMIRLKVEINVVDPNEENGSKLVLENTYACEEGCSAKYRLTITNPEHLKALRSPKFMWRNTLWYLLVYKDHSGQIGIGLSANKIMKESSPKIKVSAKIISTKVGVKAVERVGTWKLEQRASLLMKRLVSLDELTKPENGFIQNNSITIEIKLNVDYSEDKGTKRKMETTSSGAKMLKFECAICFEAFVDQDASFTPCGHLFCTKCIEDSVKLRQLCPCCNGSVKLLQLKRAHLSR